MKSEYTDLATIFGPPSKLDDLNQLALVLGESERDIGVFAILNYEHPDTGEQYCVISTLVKPIFTEMAGRPLVAPDHALDADVEAATRAQALLSINDKLPSQDHISVRLGPRTETMSQHVQEYGLVKIEVDSFDEVN